MAEGTRRESNGAETSEPNGRLDSWKEIAAYLKRDVTTVRRWEKREGLPVRRHVHERRDSVYAYREEIDAWWLARASRLSTASTTEVTHRGELQPSHGSQRAWLPAMVAAVLVAVSAGSLAVAHFRKPPLDRRGVRFSIIPPESPGDLAFSPDGRWLAFVTGTDDNTNLWIHALDSWTSQMLPGTGGAESPFWSPDSQFIAFGGGGKLKKIAVAGGLVHTLCDARVVLGGSWNKDDVIVFSPDNRAALYRVSAGRRFLYLARGRQADQSGIYVGSLDSTATTRLMTADSSAAYAAPGYLLFAREGGLVAQPFDGATLRLTGEAMQVLHDVRYAREDSYASFSVSDHGEIAYLTAGGAARSELAWFNRGGQQVGSVAALSDAQEPSLSADGSRLAVSRVSGASRDIWLFDSSHGSSPVTTEASSDLMPIWSPDGSSIVFVSNRDGPADLYRTSPSGTEQPAVVLKSNAVKHATDWSRDGRWVVYESQDRTTGWDLWVLPIAGAEPSLFLKTPFAEHHGRLSPDGRWMAYVSNESGADEVYVRPFPPGNGKWKISIGGWRSAAMAWGWPRVVLCRPGRQAHDGSGASGSHVLRVSPPRSVRQPHEHARRMGLRRHP